MHLSNCITSVLCTTSKPLNLGFKSQEFPHKIAFYKRNKQLSACPARSLEPVKRAERENWNWTFVLWRKKNPQLFLLTVRSWWKHFGAFQLSSGASLFPAARCISEGTRLWAGLEPQLPRAPSTEAAEDKGETRPQQWTVNNVSANRGPYTQLLQRYCDTGLVDHRGRQWILEGWLQW